MQSLDLSVNPASRGMLTFESSTSFELELMSRVNLGNDGRTPDISPGAITSTLSFARLTSRPDEVPALRTEEFEQAARSRVTSAEIASKLIQPPKGLSLAVDRVIGVLTNGRWRRGPLRELETRFPEFRERVAMAIREGRPVDLILPSMSPKSPNPLATGNSIGHTDLGEHLFVAQVRDVLDSIQAVYEPGARMIVLSDAKAYMGIFTPHGTEPEIARYRNGVRRIRDEMGMTNRLAILDLDAITRSDPRFSDVRQTVSDRIVDLCAKGDPETRLRMTALTASMLLYVPFAFNN